MIYIWSRKSFQRQTFINAINQTHWVLKFLMEQDNPKSCQVNKGNSSSQFLSWTQITSTNLNLALALDPWSVYLLLQSIQSRPCSIVTLQKSRAYAHWIILQDTTIVQTQCTYRSDYLFCIQHHRERHQSQRTEAMELMELVAWSAQDNLLALWQCFG